MRMTQMQAHLPNKILWPFDCWVGETALSPHPPITPLWFGISKSIQALWSWLGLVGATEDRDDPNDESEDETKEKDDGDALLRDFQYQIKCQYMEKNRNLRAARSHLFYLIILSFYFPFSLQVPFSCVPPSRGSQRCGELHSWLSVRKPERIPRGSFDYFSGESICLSLE